jgi:hypothetical protein
MNIIEVELQHTNPSMGPHETKTSYTIQVKDFSEQVKNLLEKTIVNSKVQLGEFLKMMDSKDYNTLKTINDSFDPGPLNSGSTISLLIFTKDDRTTLTLTDLRLLDLKGYYQTDFLKVIVNNGSKYVSTPMSVRDDNLIRRPILTEENDITEMVEDIKLKK